MGVRGSRILPARSFHALTPPIRIVFTLPTNWKYYSPLSESDRGELLLPICGNMKPLFGSIMPPKARPGRGAGAKAKALAARRAKNLKRDARRAALVQLNAIADEVGARALCPKEEGLGGKPSSFHWSLEESL